MSAGSVNSLLLTPVDNDFTNTLCVGLCSSAVSVKTFCLDVVKQIGFLSDIFISTLQLPIVKMARHGFFKKVRLVVHNL